MTTTTHDDLPHHSARRVQVIGDSPQARVWTTEGVLVVEPRPLFGRQSLDALDRLLTKVDAPVIIDLRHLSHDGGTALDWIDLNRWHREQGSLCIVCNRTDATGVCSACGGVDPPPMCAAGNRLAVFGHVPDAIQALVLSDVGFGDGWT